MLAGTCCRPLGLRAPIGVPCGKRFTWQSMCCASKRLLTYEEEVAHMAARAPELMQGERHRRTDSR
eukprot:7709436-Alexandrium_andersonii.AAC.1